MGRKNHHAELIGKIYKKKKIVIILVILAITAGNFLIQMSFIESDNKRIIESLIKTPPAPEQKIQPQTEVVENNSPTTVTDEVLTPKTLETEKVIKTEKIIHKDASRQAEPALKQNPLKKEAKRESKSDRLRRAEKILTGF